MQNNQDKILDYLYLGNYQFNSKDYNFIVNCTKDITYDAPFIRIPIDDHPGECQRLLNIVQDSKILETIHNLINSKQKVLIHCQMGISRSCTIVAFYLIKYYKLTPKKVIEFIKSKRPIAFLGAVNFAEAINQFYSANK